MDRRSILQNILNISRTGRDDSAEKLGLSQPRPEPPRCRIPALPKPDLPKITPVVQRLKKMGVPKSSAEKMSRAYREGSQTAIRTTTTELREFWSKLIRKTPGQLEQTTQKFNIFAAVIVQQLAQALEDRYNLVLSIAEEHLLLYPPAPKPKWDKQWVPLFVWVFTSPHGLGKYPTCSQKQALAAKTKLSYRQITVWFQNRRARTKKRMVDGKAIPSFREPMRDYHWTDDLPPDERKSAIRTILGQRLGSLPSLRDQHAERIREDYLTGRSVNVLETCEPAPYSFPEPMKEWVITIPEFDTPQWPRSASTNDTEFLPIRSREVLFLADQLSVTHVTPPEEDVEVGEIVSACKTLVLDPNARNEYGDSDSDSDSDSDEDEDEEGGESELSIDTDELESVSILMVETEDEAEALLYEDVSVEENTRQAETRSEEESLCVLQKGVGNVPLKRMGNQRASTNMAPPAPPSRRRNAVCRNVFNGRPKSIPKRRLPVIRELPPVNVTKETVEEVMSEALEETRDELHYLVTEILQADSDAEDSVSGDEIECEYPDHEYWQEEPALEEILQFSEDKSTQDQIHLIRSIVDMEGFVQHPSRYDCDMSIDEGSDSGSGSSYFPSDIEDPAMMHMTGEDIDFDGTSSKYCKPLQDAELSECLQIPFDPTIAEAVLGMTLKQLGITPNFAMPLPKPANSFETYAHLLPDVPIVDEADQFGTIDLVAFSNEFTDYFYAPNATVDLGVVRPTAMEEYQATLPDPTYELVDFPIPEYGQTIGYDQPIDLAFIVSGYQEPDLAYLSSVIEPSTTAVLALPAIVASQESDFPEEYGDGSQYLVLDHAYDLNELEQDVLRLPSFLPPGGIPSDDRYPFIEPPPLESYARPRPEECKIFVTHGPTQVFYPPPMPPSLPVRPAPPPIIVPAPIQESAMVSSQPHLPPSSSQGTDGIEASRSLFSIGLNSLMNIITSAPRYILGGGSPEPPTTHIEDNDPLFWGSEFTPTPAFEEELGSEPESTSIWSTLPHLDDIIYFF